MKITLIVLQFTHCVLRGKGGVARVLNNPDSVNTLKENEGSLGRTGAIDERERREEYRFSEFHSGDLCTRK